MVSIICEDFNLFILTAGLVLSLFRVRGFQFYVKIFNLFIMTAGPRLVTHVFRALGFNSTRRI